MPDLVDLFPELLDSPDIGEAIDSPQFYREIRVFALGAEYLVGAELCFMGYVVTMSGEGSPYDLIIDAEQGLKRVQVKSCARPRSIRGSGDNPPLRYIVKDRSRSSLLIEKRFVGRGCDLFAFVALDIKRVLFIDPLFLQKTEMTFSMRDMTKEKCEMSYAAARKCLGAPLDC